MIICFLKICQTIKSNLGFMLHPKARITLTKLNWYQIKLQVVGNDNIYGVAIYNQLSQMKLLRSYYANGHIFC